MFIKRINMKEYKRFHNLTIDLGDSPKRIVALVGPNGCGKSSVFDAMIYVVKSYTGRFGSNRFSNDYHYHSLKQDPNYTPQNITIDFDTGSFDQVYEQKFIEGRQNSIISFRSSFRFNGGLKVSQISSVDDILENNYGASNAADIDQRIEQNYRRLLAKYNRYRDDNDVKPSEARKHIIEELNTAIETCLDLRIENIGSVEDNRGTLYIKKPDSETVFDYNVLSAGEKEVVDILLDLYLRKDYYTDSIYIIDEPELHLNTSIQRVLLQEINKMIPDNCQIWIATHSVGFLRAIQDELKERAQVIEFKSENSWASGEYTLTPSSCSRYDWQSLFSTALDDLSTLISPRIIVYCEGRAEPGTDYAEKGLDAYVYNQIFSHKYPDVLFISSGGNTELDQRSSIAIAIIGKVFPELKIWVLKDRDMASGNNSDEDTRKMYLENNSQNHRVLKRFEIENYLFDQEVLERYCQNKGLSFNSEKYKNAIKDIVNDNVKDLIGIIKSCCGISFSINPEAFKKNLSECIEEDMNVYKELEGVIFNRE